MNSIIEKQKVLVTGSSGFLGSHLCERLLNEGNKVFGIDSKNSSDGISESQNYTNSFHFTKLDITNVNEVERLFSDSSFDQIFHLAAVANPRACKENFELAFNVNVVGTKNILHYSNKCNNLIFMSSASIYGEPLWLPIDETHPRNGSDPYSVTKIMGEDLCNNLSKNYERNISIVRNFNTFGEGQIEDYIVPTLIRQALNHKIEIWNSSPIRDMTYVDNTIDALLRIGASDKRSDLNIYNIGTGKGIQIGQLATTIRDMIDSTIEIRDMQKRLGGSPRLVANNDKLEQLGWREKISLKDGLSKTIDWFKSQ